MIHTVGISVNDTVIGDPLFTVTLPEGNEYMCYEVHGEAGKYFNLISDTCTSVNALFSTLPGDQRINRMSEIGIYARDTSGACVQIQINLNGCLGYVDGTLLISAYSQNSIAIRRFPNRWRVSVPNCGISQVVMWIFCDTEPDMIRFHIARGNNLAATSHGLLGKHKGCIVIGKNLILLLQLNSGISQSPLSYKMVIFSWNSLTPLTPATVLYQLSWHLEHGTTPKLPATMWGIPRVGHHNLVTLLSL